VSGKFEKISGVDCYVATPTGDYAKDKVVLFITDVFGPQLVNAQLLADGFANNGLKVVIPDLFDGDGWPADALTAPILVSSDTELNIPFAARFQHARHIAGVVPKASI